MRRVLDPPKTARFSFRPPSTAFPAAAHAEIGGGEKSGLIRGRARMYHFPVQCDRTITSSSLSITELYVICPRLGGATEGNGSKKSHLSPGHQLFGPLLRQQPDALQQLNGSAAGDRLDAAHASGDPSLAGDGAKPDVAGRSEWQPPKSSPPARQRQHDLDENIVPLASVFGGRIVIVLLELNAEVRCVGDPCRGCRRVQVHLERA